jgi:hypothetical protein
LKERAGIPGGLFPGQTVRSAAKNRLLLDFKKAQASTEASLSGTAPWKAEIGFDVFSICVDLSNLRLT